MEVTEGGRDDSELARGRGGSKNGARRSSKVGAEEWGGGASERSERVGAVGRDVIRTKAPGAHGARSSRAGPSERDRRSHSIITKEKKALVHDLVMMGWFEWHRVNICFYLHVGLGCLVTCIWVR
jgi:hypothetical protein